MFITTGDGKETEPSSSSLQGSQPCRHLELAEILLATKNFDESLVIGRGGFGKVYKGTIFNGSAPVLAAIKRLDSMSKQGAAEFWAEVDVLSKLRHCHLVSLIGYCNHEKEMILVYEYMLHGTLEDHLHKLCTPLSWLERLKICKGAARGLDYLHTGTGIEQGVIHRDVKSSNILLHETWAAKISDFGLCRISPTNQPSTYVNTLVKGTFGYLDPDYFYTGRLTRKSDVYAFGVVLFEVLCRKRAVDGSLDEEQWNLARWAQDSIKQGSLKHIIDSDIRGQISPKCLKDYVRIAQRCLHSQPKRRPTMAGVVFSLESVLTLQETFNSSLQAGGKTIFGRVVDMFPFSNGENSVHGDSKLSSNSKSNNTFLDTRVPADFRIPNPSLKVFKFSDLKRATRNFSPDLVVGMGFSSGEVFVGWVDKNTLAPSRHGVGIAVAVKRYISSSSEDRNLCLTKVCFLGWLTHPNNISLLGYYIDKNEGFVVYEYIQNQSLDHYLLRNVGKPLSWGTRLNILIGVARGLAYLHSSKHKIIHRDVKSSNIFLDQEFNAKLAGFELARSGPEIGETHVSTAVKGKLTVKSDIYSFGMVFLETLTGLKEFDSQRPQERVFLVMWAYPIMAERRELKKIMDPRLEQNYPLEGAFQCAALARRCLADKPKDRPSSEEVLQCLEQIYAINE